MNSRAVQTIARVVEQQPMARDTYRLRLRCPEIARRILPGQFFMLRLPEATDPLLGRPFALYDTWDDEGEPAGVDFGYIAVGKLTSLMTAWEPGQTVDLWGPLGNGFPPPPPGHLMMVAGGIGQTPFLAVAREALGLKNYGLEDRGSKIEDRRDRDSQSSILDPRSSVSLCYGVRTGEYLAGLDDFDLPGLEVTISTDDGTRGHHGLVTDLLAEALDGGGRPDTVYCCGPEPMMKAAAEMCTARKVRCLLSLESPMACGFGACFSCAVRVRTDDGGWDYRRSCVEGPVFDARRLIL